MMLTALALLLLAVLLWLAARWLRRRSGLPAGQVIYSDTGAWQRNDRTLSAPAYQLIGKPDYLVRRGFLSLTTSALGSESRRISPTCGAVRVG